MSLPLFCFGVGCFISIAYSIIQLRNSLYCHFNAWWEKFYNSLSMRDSNPASHENATAGPLTPYLTGGWGPIFRLFHVSLSGWLYSIGLKGLPRKKDGTSDSEPLSGDFWLPGRSNYLRTFYWGVTTPTIRVTRSGEFSAMGGCFQIGQAFENWRLFACDRSISNLLATFLHSAGFVLILTKHALGQIWGVFLF
jgi:hypothetical protein